MVKTQSDKVWDVVGKNYPAMTWFIIVMILVAIVAIPVAVAAIFSVSVWVPIVTMLFGWAVNIVTAVTRNYLYLKSIVKRQRIRSNG